MKRLVLAAAVISALLFAACSDDDEDSGNGSGLGPTETAAEESSDPATSPEPATETPIPNVCGPNPAPGTPETIQVDAPAPFTKHRASVTVTGKIAAFEATFKVRVLDANGAVLTGVTAMTAEGQVLSPFSEEVFLQTIAEQPACIWVYEESARDGNPTNIAQVPIAVAP